MCAKNAAINVPGQRAEKEKDPGAKIDEELENYYYSLDQKDRSLGHKDINYAVDMRMNFMSNT